MSIAAKLKISNEEDFADLVQVGLIGLLKAIRKFDESRGVKLSTLAWKCISREIRRELKKVNKSNIRYKNLEFTSEPAYEELRLLWECIPNSLNETEKKIIQDRVEGRILSEIGRDIGCSKQWVNHLLEIAIKKIKGANA